MPITLTKAVVDRFEREIEVRYKSDKEAARGMRVLLSRYESGGIAPELSAAMSGSDGLDLPLPPLEDTAHAHTLAGKVAEVCERYADEQWTMRRMLKYLRQVDFPLKEKPEGSISACLGKLARDERLNILRQGSGSSPSIYQWNSGSKVSPTPSTDSDSGECDVQDECSDESPISVT